MAFFAWLIKELDRNVEDGFVHTVFYCCQCFADSNVCTVYGSVQLERPTDALIPYELLTEQQVVQWVKDKLGAESVQAIEADLQAKLNELIAPTSLKGVPWLEVPSTSPIPEPEAPVLTRARNADGTFIADDPATPDVNEAWVTP